MKCNIPLRAFGILFLCCLLMQLHGEALAQRQGQQVTLPYYVYSEDGQSANNFVPSGWMGDRSSLKLDLNWRKSPFAGQQCIKFEYSGKGGEGWAGIYWLKHWGNEPGEGLDLRGASTLELYVRGEKGGENIKLVVGGITGKYPDSDKREVSVTLSQAWERVVIDVSDLDLRYITGGLAVVVSQYDNRGNGVKFYLDDIVYRSATAPATPPGDDIQQPSSNLVPVSLELSAEG